MAISVQLGTTAIHTFETLDKPNGARVAPASLPTVEYLHVNGVINSAIVPTITQMQDAVPANITGYYKITFATSTLAKGDDVHVSVSATVNSVIAKTVFHFILNDEPTQVPVIR